MITVRGLKKKISKDFHLEIGELHIRQGLCVISGASGSGKSTFLELVASASDPDEGELLWNGIPYKQHLGVLRSQIGYVPSEVIAYEEMTTEQLLRYMAGLKGNLSTQSIESVLTLFRLVDIRRRRMNSLSVGIQRRIILAQAFLGAPSIMVMDEPLKHVDPFEAERLRTLFALYARRNTMIIADDDPNAWITNQHLTMESGKLYDNTTY
ncbi:ATP-binding cassette domain-containing protein [Paenibacillus arenosi]|uniref:ATP-binding cassette domain-containing protein n=1 Tax=Paenibacillus arenosi TaxID=2774142 RepID=A0ABR9ATW1_9BACL|nr:ATP-binding cassette domain-containing protein [Paenibacillus arenosi]MBD8497549.1 ATP-binding cassette domain-containing protein [Paenibacillus arenosi]